MRGPFRLLGLRALGLRALALRVLEMRLGSVRLLGATLLLATLIPGGALAEHEANHRYTVRGYVLDAQEQPVAGTRIAVRMGGMAIGTGRTDDRGYYSIQLHLHDSDIGRKLVVDAGEREAEIRMTAERGDRSTRRIHHLSFVGDRVVEAELDRPGLPRWTYGAAAFVALTATGVVVGRRVQRRAKRLRRQQQAQSQPRHGRGGSRKRRKDKRRKR